MCFPQARTQFGVNLHSRNGVTHRLAESLRRGMVAMGISSDHGAWGRMGFKVRCHKLDGRTLTTKDTKERPRTSKLTEICWFSFVDLCALCG